MAGRKPGSKPAFGSGAAAIAGVVVGGLLGFLGSVTLAIREDNREDDRIALETRGAARLLVSELLQTGGQMAVLGNDRILRRFDNSYGVQLRPEDRLLVAAKLGGERWDVVQQSLTNIDQLETFVNTQVHRGRRRLTAGEVCYVRLDLRSVRVALDELVPLSEAPRTSDLLPDVSPCQPDPGSRPRGP